MKKILLILMLFTPIITWGQKSDLIKFLDACKTFEFEESKEIISKYSFNLGNMYDLLNYKDIPDLRISKEQYEIVLEEFKNRRFIDYKGYGIEYLTLNFEIFNFAEKGGFTVERDLYILSFDTFQMQLERLEKELSPDTAAKVDDVVGKAKNITELLIGLSALAEKMNL